ncbi:tyrosine-type recombinase/integrase [Crateriforma spongiae]|uniref:tyrosine-type recombinase/integrase n=1 Tax=Crateriforma spongiae TaxID=2724528 RepID=UPI0039B0C3A4
MKKSGPDIPRHLQHFLGEHLVQDRGCSLNTVHSYRDALCAFLTYLQHKKNLAPRAITASDFSAENVVAFLSHLQRTKKCSDSTRNQRLSAIRAFARYLCWKEPLISSDMESILAIPSKRTSRQVLGFLDRDEMEAILDAPDANTWSGKRDRALLAMMYNTGARVSEVVSAIVSDVTLKPSGTFRFQGKGRKERLLPLWKSTSKTLGQWIKGTGLRPSQPLFPNARGAMMTRSGVEKRLKQAIIRATSARPSLVQKRISPHTLRHTTAMHLLQSGVDITLIAMWLGHESIETTHLYITANLELKEATLAALQPVKNSSMRFQPDDELLKFLKSL